MILSEISDFKFDIVKNHDSYGSIDVYAEESDNFLMEEHDQLKNIENIYFNHTQGILFTEENIIKLHEHFTILGTSMTKNNKQIVSVIKHN